jgi:hypothetical protein
MGKPLELFGRLSPASSKEPKVRMAASLGLLGTREGEVDPGWVAAVLKRFVKRAEGEFDVGKRIQPQARMENGPPGINIRDSKGLKPCSTDNPLRISLSDGRAQG